MRGACKDPVIMYEEQNVVALREEKVQMESFLPISVIILLNAKMMCSMQPVCSYPSLGCE